MADQEQIDELRALVPQRRRALGPGVAGAIRPVGVEIPQAELRLLGYLRAIYRRRFVVAGVAATAVGMTLAYTLSQPHVYQARARLLIEAGGPNVVMFTPVMEDRPNADYYNTQYEILRSRTLAERTIDTMGLWSHPELGGTAGDGAAADLTPRARAGRVSAFLSRLGISQVLQSRIVEISFRAEDPALAADVANTLIRVYMEQNLEARARPTTDAAESLREMLDAQRKQVEASEVALQRYREQNDAVSLEEGQNIVVQRLVQLSTAVTAARATRIEKAGLYDQLRSIQQSRAPLDTFPAILSNSFIQGLKSELAELQQREAQLSEQFGELHPEIIQIRGAMATAESKLKVEVDKAAEAVRNEFLAAEAREKEMARALEAQQREVLALDRKSIGYGALQRDAATNRQIYESLLQRAKETEVAGTVQDTNVRLIDAAQVPSDPLSRGTTMFALLAVVWGGVLGVGFVFALEFFDRRIKSPEDVQQHLALPYFGLAPAARNSAALRLLGNGVPPEFTEAIRSVGANLLESPASISGSVLVTSAASGEGKTSIAGNLALALARVGQRVILVDADLRRPRVHELFAASRGPGLTDVLLGSEKVSAVIQNSTTPGLWHISAGTHAARSADLLGSERLPPLISSLSEAFDWVIVDSAPVLAVADTSFVARAVSAVLLVVDADATKRETVQAAIERLEALHARPIGVVLNRADLRRNADYQDPSYTDESADDHGGGVALS
jgi:capsular exopolysaccharide synthesis family protein